MRERDDEVTGAQDDHDDQVVVETPQGVGVPDGVQRLWTPQRMAYIQGEGKPPDASAGEGCPFCRVQHLPDEEGLVVARGTSAFVVLNLYPYNSGHVLVCPYRHVADYSELTSDEVLDVAEMTRHAMGALRRAYAPHGFNLGMNQGSAAGAGIAAHLHQHVVPRWGGDANFMPVIAHTKALPELLRDTRKRIAEAWSAAS